MTDLMDDRKRRQARFRRRKYLKDPVKRALDMERSRNRYADVKKRKSEIEFLLDRNITLSEFYSLEAKATEKESD